jgi:MFS family permease
VKSLDRRNFLALAGDFVFFGIGLSFASQTTVLPSFVATLTRSAPLIGLVSTLATGGWLLPQIFAANAVAGRPRRKASVIIPAAASRVFFLALGPLMLLLAPRRPAAALAAFFSLFFLFFVADGIASVSWLDIIGKCLPARLRARMIGVGQAGSGIAGIAVGLLVGIILSSERLPYPSNYALLLFLGGAMLALSIVSFAFLKEEPEHTGARPLPWPEYFRRLWRILRGDGDFRRAVVVQLLFGMTGLATPFYVIHGLASLGFGELSVGIFTSAQVAGGVLSALLMGYVGEKKGTRAVMRIGGGISLATPLLALAITLAVPLAGTLLPSAGLMYLYAIVFVIVGAQANSIMAGFINYVLEFAPASDRAMYIGFANTASGVSLFAPLVGGALLAAGGSYAALFIAAAAGPLAGLVLSLRLVEPRRR